MMITMNQSTIKGSTLVLAFAYLFILIAILGDLPLIIFFSRTRSVSFTRSLLFGLEFIILLMFAFLLLDSFKRKIPNFLYIYVGYIILMTIVSVFYYEPLTVLRDARKFLAPLPPLFIGYYITLFSPDKKDQFINRLIIFLTAMSIVGIVEWCLCCLFPNGTSGFYSSFFDVGNYYNQVRETSGVTESGIMLSGIRPSGFFIPGVTKRLTGLYLEPFAAGFNAVFAVILILYVRMSGNRKLKWEYFLLSINIVAVILTTSRSSYLLLFIALTIYLLMSNRIHPVFFLCFLTLLYTPFRELCFHSVKTLGGGKHQETISVFFDYLINNLFTFKGIVGEGIGSRWFEYAWLYIESGYGYIFGQLGIAGILGIILLFLISASHIYSNEANNYFTIVLLASVAILLLFSGYIFGYKTFGLIYMFLGSLMTKPYSALEFLSSFNPTRPGLLYNMKISYLRT
jgi:hypothetical protein